jgi:hypothetical protein
LDLSKDILNPDMFNQGEKPRCLQISKARGVASSLIASSIQETVDAGRRKKGHQDAIEGCSFKLMIESTSPAIAPWIMADTMEHMLRLDFIILMQLLCRKFLVPENIGLNNVQRWLETGDSAHSPILQNWIQSFENQFITRAPLDRRGGNLTELASCMYITHTSLGCVIQDPNMSADSIVCETIGSVLFKQYRFSLAQDCQIHESLSGEEIIKFMLICNVNQQFTWPSVFGSINTLPNFWMNAAPAENAEVLSLSPLRIVISEARRACLCVDIRWLLLVSVLCGTNPSQSSRHVAVGQWIQQFYKNCVPNRMMCSKELFIGLPSPVMHGGFVCPPVVMSGRRLLRRPTMSSFTVEIGPSGMVEDLGPAAPRYQLAKLLKVCERNLPTNCVRYSLPHDQWTPIRIQSDGSFASIKTKNDGRFELDSRGIITDITAAVDDDNENFLDGRVNVDVRPLCIFDRPGVILNHADVAGIITRYEQGVYHVLQSDQLNITLNPYQAEDAVLKIGTVVYVKIEAFSDWKDNDAIFYSLPNRQGEVEGRNVLITDVLECTLAIPINENMPEGTGRATFRLHTDIGMESVAYFGSSQMGSDQAVYSVGSSLDIHISHFCISRPENATVYISVYCPEV